jgi:hypothetical protein
MLKLIIIREELFCELVQKNRIIIIITLDRLGEKNEKDEPARFHVN